MGMDVYGNKPKNKTGKYFRNNLRWWPASTPTRSKRLPLKLVACVGRLGARVLPGPGHTSGGATARHHPRAHNFQRANNNKGFGDLESEKPFLDQ
jgi:hypothetical protein